MELHMCKCSYSTTNKSNYNKHIKICKQFIEPITDAMYEENQSKYDMQLSTIKEKFQQQLEEQVAIIRKEYKDKLEQDIDRITNEYEKRKKKYKYKRENLQVDEETQVKQLRAICKTRGIEYDKTESADTLRKMIKNR